MTIYIIIWLNQNWEFNELPIKAYHYIEDAKNYIEDEYGKPLIWNNKNKLHQPDIGDEFPRPVILELEVL